MEEKFKNITTDMVSLYLSAFVGSRTQEWAKTFNRGIFSIPEMRKWVDLKTSHIVTAVSKGEKLGNVLFEEMNFMRKCINDMLKTKSFDRMINPPVVPESAPPTIGTDIHVSIEMSALWANIG